MEYISSTRNERVKNWSEIKQAKGRKATGTYLIEGVRSVEEALRHEAPLEAILVESETISTGKLDMILNLALSRGIEVLEVTAPIIEKVADTKTPQGAIAIAKMYQNNLNGILAARKGGFYLLLDHISDPGNLGTLIRTADAALVDAVIVGEDSVDIYNPKVVRSTMGSLFHLPVIQADAVSSLLLLRKAGLSVIGTTAAAETSIFEVELQKDVVVVIGSEAHGMAADVDALVDTRVSIPMPGKAESLNAAVAGSVILYEALRQRMVVQKP